MVEVQAHGGFITEIQMSKNFIVVSEEMFSLSLILLRLACLNLMHMTAPTLFNGTKVKTKPVNTSLHGRCYRAKIF